MDFIEAYRQACEKMDQGLVEDDVEKFMLGVSLIDEYELPFMSEEIVIPQFPKYPKLINQLYRSFQVSFSATSPENQQKAMRFYSEARSRLNAHLEENFRLENK